MLDTLRMVRGAVSDKAVVSVLTHFCITEKRIQGANGRVYIDCPVPDLDFNAVVPAERFLRAIDACDGEPIIAITETGKVSIKRGKFRALLPSLPITEFPRGQPSAGKRKDIGPGLLEAIQVLRGFVSLDAERAWASSIFFHDGTVYATNSAMIATMKCAAFKEDAQIPVFGTDELLRIGEPPEQYSKDETSITFYWKGDRWLRSQLLASDWPLETARKWLEMKAEMKQVPKDLARDIEQLKAFCDNPKFPVIYFSDKGITTAPGDSQAEMTGYDLGEGVFHADNLLPMLAQTDQIAILDNCALFQSKDKRFRGIMAKLKLAGYDAAAEAAKKK